MNEKNNILALRLIISYWPDSAHILRGVEVGYGAKVAGDVQGILERRRSALEQELQQMEVMT